MLAQLGLRLREFTYHRSHTLQSLEYSSVLNALLKNALDVALRRTYVTSDGSHLAHINLAQDEEERHNADYQTSQATIHAEKIYEGSDQAERYFKQGRQCLCNTRSKVAHVLFHSVECVATMSVFLSIPFALEQTGKESFLEDVKRTNTKQGAHPLSCKTKRYLGDHYGHKSVSCRSQTAFSLVGCDVYRPFCRIDESEVETDRQNTDAGIKHSLQAQSSRGAPEPKGKVANRCRHNAQCSTVLVSLPQRSLVRSVCRKVVSGRFKTTT